MGRGTLGGVPEIPRRALPSLARLADLGSRAYIQDMAEMAEDPRRNAERTSASNATARRSMMLWRRRGSANGGRLANDRHAQADPKKRRTVSMNLGTEIGFDK